MRATSTSASERLDCLLCLPAREIYLDIQIFDHIASSVFQSKRWEALKEGARSGFGEAAGGGKSTSPTRC